MIPPEEHSGCGYTFVQFVKTNCNIVKKGLSLLKLVFKFYSILQVSAALGNLKLCDEFISDSEITDGSEENHESEDTNEDPSEEKILIVDETSVESQITTIND